MTPLFFVVAAALQAGPAPVPAPASAPVEVKASTAPAAPSISSIYTVERLRDPFVPGGMGGGGGSKDKPFTPQDFNIHNLTLKGIMKDGAENYALLYDTEFGLSFILRKGRIFDTKNKPIPNVKGTIVAKEKTVRLQAAEGDVQVLRLGQTDEEEEK